MKDKLLLVLGYIIGGIGAVIVTPFAIIYYGILMFWKLFASTVIAYIILALLGCSYEESLEYGAGLGLLITIYLKYRELKK